MPVKSINPNQDRNSGEICADPSGNNEVHMEIQEPSLDKVEVHMKNNTEVHMKSKNCHLTKLKSI